MKASKLLRFVTAIACTAAIGAAACMSASAATKSSDWTIDKDKWTVTDSSDGFTMKNAALDADSDCMYNNKLTGAFDISFDIAFNNVQDKVDSARICLRMPTDPTRMVFVRVKGVNQGFLVEAQHYITTGDKWSDFYKQSDWTPYTSDKITVKMSRAAGSNALKFQILDGAEVKLDKTFEEADAINGDNFYDKTTDEIAGLDFMLGADADGSIVSFSNIAVNAGSAGNATGAGDDTGATTNAPAGNATTAKPNANPSTGDTANALPLLIALLAAAIVGLGSLSLRRRSSR